MPQGRFSADPVWDRTGGPHALLRRSRSSSWLARGLRFYLSHQPGVLPKLERSAVLHLPGALDGRFVVFAFEFQGHVRDVSLLVQRIDSISHDARLAGRNADTGEPGRRSVSGLSPKTCD